MLPLEPLCRTTAASVLVDWREATACRRLLSASLSTISLLCRRTGPCPTAHQERLLSLVIFIIVIRPVRYARRRASWSALGAVFAVLFVVLGSPATLRLFAALADLPRCRAGPPAPLLHGMYTCSCTERCTWMRSMLTSACQRAAAAAPRSWYRRRSFQSHMPDPWYRQKVNGMLEDIYKLQDTLNALPAAIPAASSAKPGPPCPTGEAMHGMNRWRSS